jgi:hypothetical protein
MNKQKKKITVEEIKESFPLFLYMVWRHLRLPKPTPIQLRIADFLTSTLPRIIVEGYRGVGKSWITSALTNWLLLRNPNAKILVVSASKDRAMDFSTFTQRLLYDIPVLQHLIPRRDQRQSKVSFDVNGCTPAHAPSVKSIGVTGQLTGSRADYIIADDIEVPTNSATPDMREKLVSRVAEFEAILKPNGRIIYLGTPQTEESIYNELAKRGYVAKIFPAEYPALDKLPSYEGKLDEVIEEKVRANPELVGKATDPDRFDERILRERKMVYGKSGYALQFMLDTSLSDAEKYPLKTSDLIVCPTPNDKAPTYIAWANMKDMENKELKRIGFTGDRWYNPLKISDDWQQFEHIAMAIDPSGRGKDETTYAIVGTLYGSLYLLDCEGYRDGYSKVVLSKLAMKAREYNVNKILIENNFGDGMFTALFKPYVDRACNGYMDIEEIRSSTHKETRIIATLEPLMNQHKLVVHPDVITKDLAFDLQGLDVQHNLQYSLFYQMTRLTAETGCLRHDDKLDALAMVCEFYVNRVSRDLSREIKKRDERLLDKELEKIYSEMYKGKKTNRRDVYGKEYYRL